MINPFYSFDWAGLVYLQKPDPLFELINITAIDFSC